MFRRCVVVSYLIVFSCAVGPVAALDLNLNQLGDLLKKGTAAFEDISVEKEVEIGQGVAEGLLGVAPLVKHPELQKYVNRVGRWLAMQTERPDLPWTFGVIESASYNAFATPGGYIFITRGLFSLMRTESELAGVLAHEISHVIERHHLNAIKSHARNELAADLLTELGSQKGFGGNKQLLGALVNSGVALYGKGLDREDEIEADRLGVVIAARAGYEPFGLPGVLLALDGLSAGDQNIALMTSTHPSFAERLAALDDVMAASMDRFLKQQTLAERFLEVQRKL